MSPSSEGVPRQSRRSAKDSQRSYPVPAVFDSYVPAPHAPIPPRACSQESYGWTCSQESYTTPRNCSKESLTAPPNCSKESYTTPPNCSKESYATPPNCSKESYAAPPHQHSWAATTVSKTEEVPTSTGQPASSIVASSSETAHSTVHSVALADTAQDAPTDSIDRPLPKDSWWRRVFGCCFDGNSYSTYAGPPKRSANSTMSMLVPTCPLCPFEPPALGDLLRGWSLGLGSTQVAGCLPRIFGGALVTGQFGGRLAQLRGVGWGLAGSLLPQDVYCVPSRRLPRPYFPCEATQCSPHPDSPSLSCCPSFSKGQ